MGRKAVLVEKKQLKIAKRKHKAFVKNHYKETVDYAIDCFIKECNS